VDALEEEQPLIVSGLKIILNEPSFKVPAACNWSDVITIFYLSKFNKTRISSIMLAVCIVKRCVIL